MPFLLTVLDAMVQIVESRELTLGNQQDGAASLNTVELRHKRALNMHVIDDTDDRIRDLCREIAEEHDPDKVNEMCARLRQLFQVQHNTTRLRLQNIAMRFGIQMRSAP